MEELSKQRDESWKEQVEKEKQEGLKETPEALPAADFNFFVTTFSLQASIFLGMLPNPATSQKEENLPQAKFLIDTLAMLQEKTKGNLTKEEGEFLENSLYELRMCYVEKNQGKGGRT